MKHRSETAALLAVYGGAFTLEALALLTMVPGYLMQRAARRVQSWAGRCVPFDGPGLPERVAVELWSAMESKFSYQEALYSRGSGEKLVAERIRDRAAEIVDWAEKLQREPFVEDRAEEAPATSPVLLHEVPERSEAGSPVTPPRHCSPARPTHVAETPQNDIAVPPGLRARRGAVH